MRLRTRPPLLTYLLTRRMLRLLQRYRFPAVTMVHLGDVGCLQGEG